MELPIPNIILRLWDAWILRSCILLSLLLQAFLLFASNRKRTGRKVLLMFIWLAYFLADWIAAVAIGLISKSRGDACHQAKGIGREDYIAFWASFLLLHLGGPDTITSFAVEDNEFWLRHLAGLALQVLATAYIFYQSLPKNKLWVPTALVFVVGTIKYVERTRALFYASVDQFGNSVCVLPVPDPGPDYEETVEIYSARRSVRVETHVDVMPTPEVGIQTIESTGRKQMEELQLLQEAYDLFERFKGLFVGILLSSIERKRSRNFFREITATEAFKLIECELSFMYEVLHTKTVVVRCKTGYLLRFISFSLLLGAFVVFLSIEQKQHEFPETFDINLTYVLLMGALGLEVISVLMLIFSDRTLLALKTSRWSKPISAIILKRGRWSKSVSQYDMISCCLNDPPSWVYTLASQVGAEGVLQMLKILCFSHSEKINDVLKAFIFTELRLKSLIADDLRASKEACSQRGDWALLLNDSYRELKWSIGEYQYAESLLLWHMATKLCYHKCRGADENNRKKISKLLSDYMFYLLVMQHAMMAPVLGNWANSQIVFQDTRAEAKRFFRKKKISNQYQACEEILAVKTPFRSVDLKGNKCKSMFFDACQLAKQLLDLEITNIDPWVLISRVWLEMLSYAAIKCTPNVHAQQPSKGGELLTFIWLLMNHLGLGTQFYEEDNKPITKMIPLR